jgi:hypothetical protein
MTVLTTYALSIPIAELLVDTIIVFVTAASFYT